MTKEYAAMPPTQVRRADREVTDETWIKALLHRGAVGYLATVHGERPFINSNLYVYDETSHAIYTHTAKKGRTQANVGGGAPVCFTVTEMGRLLPADEALEFSVEYAGVVVFGTAVIVTDEAEATRALQLLLNKYAPHLQPGQDYRPPVPEELKRTAVFRINVEQWSGKQKEATPDFPGAYLYEDVIKNKD
jgi:nitroimidazol reductase NimA-like FMN-containing flavoprotein (pyridoxamine 5'-phosphate oxidase superfamily)